MSETASANLATKSLWTAGKKALGRFAEGAADWLAALLGNEASRRLKGCDKLGDVQPPTAAISASSLSKATLQQESIFGRTDGPFSKAGGPF